MTSILQPPATAKIRDIQGLRALAVLAVVLYHFLPALIPGGFLGVDVFFVISGFVIANSLLRYPVTRLRPMLMTFFSRRLRRLGPALGGMVLSVLLFAILFIPPGFDFGDDIYRTGFAAIVGLGNVALFLSGREYFNNRLEFNPFTHTWSLGVEEQFYLVLPIILWALTAGTARRLGAGRHQRQLIVVGGLSLLSFAWAAVTTNSDHIGAFYLIFSRFWELGFGVFLALILWERSAPAATGLAVRAIGKSVGLLLILGAFIFGEYSLTPFPAAVPAVAGTGLILFFLDQRQESSQFSPLSPASWPFVQEIGNASYSIYLWHWPVLVGFTWTVGLTEPIDFALAFGLVSLFSAASYIWLERPVTSRNRSEGSSAARLWAIVLALGLAGVLALIADQGLTRALSLSVTARAGSFEFEKGFQPAQPFSGKIWLVGDSHATHLSFLANEFDPGYRLLRASNCGEGVDEAGLLPPMSCEGFANAIQVIQAEAAPGDVVVMSWLQLPRVSGAYFATGSEPEKFLSELEANERRLLANDTLESDREVLLGLKSEGVSVIVPTPTPVFFAPVFRCLDWFNQSNPVCEGGFRVERNLVEAISKPVMERMRQLENEELLVIWDTLTPLCPETTCSAEQQGVWLFRDGDHLTVGGNQVVMPSFASLIETSVGPN